MGLVQKSTQKSYFSRDAFVGPMKWDRFELIMKFLHFVDNNTVDIYIGTKNVFQNSLHTGSATKIFKVYTCLQNIQV